MNRFLYTLFLLGIVGGSLFASPLEVKRYGIFIGANDGGQERQRLLYAGEDARKMADTMKAVGGIAPENSHLLLNPDIEEIKDQLREIRHNVNRMENKVRRTELMFYYSGHSDEKGLLVKEEQLMYKEIRKELDKVGADVVIAVLDSCSSGAFTRMKGGQRRSPFLIDESSSMEGHAFLTSSSEDELSQESDRIGASFFTHYLISGLRGAADTTGDGRVTLNEIYQHTFDETLSETESTLGGPQHPSYEIQLTGTGDLVLTDLTVPTSALQFSGTLAGRYAVRNSSGRLVAEFTKQPGDTLKMALPSGDYEIRMTDPETESIRTAELSLNRNTQIYLTESDFSSGDLEETRFRGDQEPMGPSGQGMFVFSPLPGVDLPEAPGRDDYVIMQGGLIGSIAPRMYGFQAAPIFNMVTHSSVGIQAAGVYNLVESDLSGVQAAGIFNITEGNMNGVQAGGIFNIVEGHSRSWQEAGIFNIAEGNVVGVQNAGIFNIGDGSVKGVQVAGIFNISDEDLIGVQSAGLFNMAGMPSYGVQVAGMFNMAEEFGGVQVAGMFNQTEHLQGLQVAPVNVAKISRGVQIGVVNVAREMHGMPIGLLNISRNGIMDAGFWYQYSGKDKIFLSYQSGTRMLYTLFYWGNSKKDFFEDPAESAWGMHLGFRVPFGPLEFDIDGGLKQTWADIHEDEYSAMPVPSARALVSIRGLGLFWGVTMDFQTPMNQDSSLFEGKSVDFSDSFFQEGYYKFMVGLRI